MPFTYGFLISVALLLVVASAIACRTVKESEALPVAGFQPVERGEDYTRFARVHATTNSTGQRTLATNSVILVDTGLNYLENGVWKESANLIESTPTGIVARRGPVEARFSASTANAALFDLHKREGENLTGGFRALNATDPVTGRSVGVAHLRTNLTAELLPPNRILYRDAFVGASGDLLLEWRHNELAQEVVLREAPPIPEGIDPLIAQLEVVTEIRNSTGDPAFRSSLPAPILGSTSGPGMVEMGSFAIAPPEVNPSPGQSSTLERRDRSNGKVSATNQLQRLADGRQFLVQSLPWRSLGLPTGRSPRNLTPSALNAPRSWPEPATNLPAIGTPKVASTNYEPAGLVVRTPILMSSTLTNFVAGQTYVLASSYHSATPVRFETNSVIKFGKTNAYLFLSGPALFPLTGPGPVFTSKDDDLFGESIPSIYNARGDLVVEGTDGWAFDFMPQQALWIFYSKFGVTVRNARFRWAQSALRFDFMPGTNATAYVDGAIFENCVNGIVASASLSTISISNTRACNVSNPAVGPTTGNIKYDCDVINASTFPRSQQEPALAVRNSPLDPSRTELLIVAMDQYGISPPGLLRMTSSDNGATWTRTRFACFADRRDGFLPAMTDSDPEVSQDSFGNFYLAYSTTFGTAFYYSADGGHTWQPVPGFSAAHTGLHMPRIATGPSGKAGVPGSVWITKQDTGRLTAVGTAVYGLGDVRSAWTTEIPLPNYGAPNPNPPFPTIAIGPAGQVAVMHVVGTGADFKSPPVTYHIAIDEDGLGPGTFTNRSSFTGNLGWEELDAANEVYPFASLDWDHARSRLYVTYPDRPDQTAGADANINISLRYSLDAARTWSDRVTLNDVSVGVRFQPRLAVDRASGYVAVWWYDSRNDPQNIRVNLFATISTDLFATSKPHNFQVNPTPFQGSVTAGDFKEYMSGRFHRGWFYPVWLDSSNSTGNNPDGTQSFDIYLARLPH